MLQVLQQQGSHLDGNFLTRKKDLLELLVTGERLVGPFCPYSVALGRQHMNQRSHEV